LFNQAKSQAGQELFVIAMTQGRRNGTWLEIGCGDPIRSNNTYLLEKRFGWTGVSIDRELMDQDIETPFEEYWSRFYNTIRQPHWPEHVAALDDLPNPDRLENIPYFKNFIKRQITDIDLIPRAQRNWQTARPGTDFYQADALTFDYSQIPPRCDYLQIDIKSSITNLRSLEMILPNHRFAVITFEHDAWDHSVDSQWVREQSRRILQNHGYQMVISDVTVPPGHGNGIGDEPIKFEDWWVDPLAIPESVWSLYQNLNDDQLPKYYFDILFKSL
jgi:hypothetical protein